MTYSEVLPTILAALPSVVIAIVSICQTQKMHDKDQEIQQKRVSEELERQERKIRVEENKRKLESFYYPYLLIAKENTSLYEVFSKEYFAKDNSFRTLTALLSGTEFPQNDYAILEQIIENDIRLKELINSRANVVDDENIRKELIKSATHYAVIELAFKKRISGEVERFEPYVHPNEVYGLVEKKAKQLEEEIYNAAQ